ncbi:MAG: aspartate-semialdehyde dehydrogenase [Thermoanaerobacteraceae bacterium]|nr:aspartate-semialdehyde dehydrogenase [Thermoanaerobacteraceae bacterium]
MKKYNVAIVGTGAVGNKLLEVLEERNFPVGNLKLLATSRSAGKQVEFKGEIYTIEETTPNSFSGVDIALFAGGSASKQFARDAVKAGAVVIDNSSTFRMDPDVPLVVPEVNPEDVTWHKGIIANPNCSTIQMVVALKPLYDAAGIKRVVVATYQAVSGAGAEAIKELERQSRQVLNNENVSPEVFPYQIAFNLLPHLDVFLDNDYTKEEMKMVNETKKILGDDSVAVTATTVRVPVFNGHSEAVNVELKKELSVSEAKELLRKAPGIVVVDDSEKLAYPMPVDADGRDEVFVGRIRKDDTVPYGLNMWVVADNLRKGAATNAVQIAELVIKNL